MKTVNSKCGQLSAGTGSDESATALMQDEQDISESEVQDKLHRKLPLKTRWQIEAYVKLIEKQPHTFVSIITNKKYF